MIRPTIRPTPLAGSGDHLGAASIRRTRRAPGATRSLTDTAPAHEALLYDGLTRYVDSVLAFLNTGLDADEPAFVAVPGAKVDLVRAALKGRTELVAFADMTALGRDPARLIPAIGAFVDAHPGRATRFVGEPLWPGRSLSERRAVVRHEVLVNTAFAGTPITIGCPYDSVGLDADAIANALRTHPRLVERGRHGPSPYYFDLHVALSLGRRSTKRFLSACTG